MATYSERDRFFKSSWAVVATVLTAAFLFFYWLLGWGFPARSDLDTFLEYGFIRNGTLTAFREDGSAEEINRSSFVSIDDVFCHKVSRRRQPSIDYYCFYTLSGPPSVQYRLVIMAVHNRGWKRVGLADVGDYRLSFHDADWQRDIFARYDVHLPGDAKDNPTGDT